MKRLTADEYRAVLRRLDLNHREAGAALGVSAGTSRRYARGGTARGATIPERTIRLLYRLMIEDERRRLGMGEPLFRPR